MRSDSAQGRRGSTWVVAAGWVDTVYLGAYPASHRTCGRGYAEDVGVNEDAEFAIRMAPRRWRLVRAGDPFVVRRPVRATAPSFASSTATGVPVR